MIKVGIIGGAAYTAGELVRILLWHPQVSLSFVCSKSHAGKPLYMAHRDLIGDTDICFSDEDYKNTDLVFLCSGHGKSKQYLQDNMLPEHVKIIDLSADYRARCIDNDFVYGLPELNIEHIGKAKRIANPGCFATAIQLAILPLAEKKILTDEIHITAITGSTGAGYLPTETSHFSWKNNNVSVYKPFTHQHIAEIKQTVLQLQADFNHDINFIPIRGNFSRGIMSTVYTNTNLSLAHIRQIYSEYYDNHPFVILVNQIPDVKQVVNTNKCLVYLEIFGNKLMIITVIDNLLKGAAGQAVQNMNIMFGIHQKEGLNLKSLAF